jgi:hypothetical protein
MFVGDPTDMTLSKPMVHLGFLKHDQYHILRVYPFTLPGEEELEEEVISIPSD